MAVYTIFGIAINVCFYVVLFMLLLRMLFQLYGTDSNNPVATSIAQFTNFAILPLRKFLPRTRYIDLSTFVCWLIVAFVRFTVIVYMHTGSFFSLTQYLVYIPADFAMQFLTVLFYSTLFFTVINFVAPGLQSYGMDTLKALSEPVLNLIRKQVPATSGFDFAPLIVLMFSKFIQVAITNFLHPAFFY